MIPASDLIRRGQWLLHKPGALVFHSFTGCWHALHESEQMEPTQVTTGLIGLIESGTGMALLCKRCFGADGRKPVTGTVTEPSRKVTIDTSTSQDDTGATVMSATPRKDDHMSRQTLPKPITPLEPDGDEAVQDDAASDAPGDAAEWSLDDLPEAMEHKPAPKSALPGWDPIKGTPAAVRKRAEESLARNAAILAAATGSKRADYRWDLQPVPDAEKGKLFSAALVKYATNRPAVAPIEFADPGLEVGRVTARCGDPAQFVKTGSGFVAYQESMDAEPFWGVRYSVRLWEQRGAGRPAGS